MNHLHDFLVLAQSIDGTGAITAEVIYGAFCILTLTGLALTFSKAGKPFWGAFIPIYNIVLMLQIARRPLWWIILLAIPLVNVVVFIVVSIDIANAFGKGTGFGWGLACLGFIFYPILGFDGSSFSPMAVGDSQSGSNRTPMLPSIDPATKSHFERLGLSLVRNHQGRAINVGFGRRSKISDGDLPALIPVGLTELYLSRTNISDESLSYFQKMSRLQVLDLSHTRFSQRGINQLRQSLPHARIIG